MNRQRIARLSTKNISLCSESSSSLELLKSFRLIPKANYLEIDWTPTELEKVTRDFGQGKAFLNGVRLVLIGERYLSSESTDETATSANSVMKLKNSFESINWDTLADTLDVQDFGLGPVADTTKYYISHLKTITEFAKIAGKESQGLVQWWNYRG